MARPIRTSRTPSQTTMPRTVGAPRAERQANADFAASLTNRKRNHAVESHRRENQGDAGESAERQHRETLFGERTIHDLLQRAEVIDGHGRIECRHLTAHRSHSTP